MKAAHLILIAMAFLTACGGAAAQAGSPTNIASNNPADAAYQNADHAARTEKMQTPESLIKEIYAIHAEDVKNEAADRIVNGSDRRSPDKYFDKKLADLIWNDLTMERGEDDTYEIGVIDFDLFYAAQEDVAPVTNLQIHETLISVDKATVHASFTGGAKEAVEYGLVEQNGTWKISDIKYRDGRSLLQRFAEATR
jgi:hypothetical protein